MRLNLEKGFICVGKIELIVAKKARLNAYMVFVDMLEMVLDMK